MSSFSGLHRRVVAFAAAAVAIVASATGGSGRAYADIPPDLVTSFNLAVDPSSASTIQSGQSFSFDWVITTNAASADTISAPVVTVTVANSACVVGVSASTIGSITPTVTKTDSKYTIAWALTDLSGGQSYSVPTVVTTDTQYCADQQTIPVTATVTDSSGDVQAANSGNPLVFTTTTGDPKITTTTTDMLGRYNPPIATSYGGVSTDGDATIGTAPGDAAVVVFTFTNSWTTSLNGLRIFSSVTITDMLPNGAVFDQSLNPDWVQVPGTNTVTYTLTAPAGSVLNIGDFLRMATNLTLNLIFPGAPTGQTLTNEASVAAIPANPGVNEKTYTASGSAQFQLVAKWAPIGIFVKNGASNPIFDVQESRAAGSYYTIAVANPATDTGMPFDVIDYSALDGEGS